MNRKELQNRLSGERHKLNGSNGSNDRNEAQRWNVWNHFLIRTQRCYFLPNAAINEESIRSRADIFLLTYPVAHHLNLRNNTIKKRLPTLFRCVLRKS